MPDKLLFGLMLAGWLALFHFLGNSTIGYVKTHSLFGWMKYALGISDADSHGLYIPWVVLGFAYWKREELLAVTKEKWWPGLSILLLGAVIHCLGYLVQQTRVSIMGFFIGLYGLMGMVWGWRWLAAVFFPYCLFVFCVPLSSETERITFPMRLYATKITAFLCQSVLQIPVIHTGTMLYDAKGEYKYEIAAACSGIKSLSATTAMAIIIGFLFFKSPWRRLVTFAAAFPLAVLGNVLRLTAIIVASEAFGHEAGQYVHDSSWLSLLPYIPAIGGLIGLVVLLDDRPRPQAAPAAAVNASPDTDRKSVV